MARLRLFRRARNKERVSGSREQPKGCGDERGELEQSKWHKLSNLVTVATAMVTSSCAQLPTTVPVPVPQSNMPLLDSFTTAQRDTASATIKNPPTATADLYAPVSEPRRNQPALALQLPLLLSILVAAQKCEIWTRMLVLSSAILVAPKRSNGVRESYSRRDGQTHR